MEILKKINLKNDLFCLGLIVLIGIFLRFWQLGKNPASLYWDEAAISLDAYSINRTGKDMNNLNWFQVVFPSYGDFKAPVFIWLTTLSFKVFGMSPWALRFPIAVFSCLIIIFSYLLAKEIVSFDKKWESKYKYLPILTAFLLSVNPWPVHFGRIGLESSLSVFWFIVSVYLFLKGVKKSGVFLVLASLSAVIGIYTYYSLRAVVPFLFFSLGIVFIKNLWKKKGWSILAIVVFIGLNLPVILSPHYEASQRYRLNNDNLARPVKVITESSEYLERYGSNLMSRVLYHRYFFWMRDYLKNYLSHFSLDFLFLSGDRNNLRHHSGYGGRVFTHFFTILFVRLILFDQ